MGIIIVVFLLICSIMTILHFAQYKIKTFFISIEERHSPEEAIGYCVEMMKYSGVVPIMIENGSYDSYNIITNKIEISQKNKYSLLDVYICLHEVGHYLSSLSKKTRKVEYGLIVLFVFSRLILTPLIMILGVISLLNDSNLLHPYIFYFYYAISFIRIISIPLTEGRANHFASKFFFEKQRFPKHIRYRNQIKLSYILAQLDQLIFCVYLVFLVVCFHVSL